LAGDLVPSTDFNDITTGPATNEGHSPGPGYAEITGLGSPKANLLVPDLVGLVHPFRMHQDSVVVDPSGALSVAPQGALHPAVLGSSLISPMDDGALGQPDGSAAVSVSPASATSGESSVANLSGAPATHSGHRSDGGTSWSTMTQNASFSDQSALPFMGSVAHPAVGDGSSADFNAASLKLEGIQWAGLNAALVTLSAESMPA